MLNFKRMMSFLLALTLLVGMMPPLQVRAEETETEAVEMSVSETTAVSEETEVTETTVFTEETEEPETTVVTEETEEPETTVATEETEAPETTVATEETEEPETTAATEETEAPETTAATEETEAPETTAATEEAEFVDIVVEDILDASQDAANATSGNCGTSAKWSYSSSTGKLSITGSGAMYDYTYTAAPWYEHRASIKTVSIGSSVTNIGNYAFYNCDALTSVTVPGNVTSIGSCAFDDCDALTSVTISSGVTSIGYRAFYDCGVLASVTIPSSVTTIGSYAFYDCYALTGLTIPSGVTSIGDYAFYWCRALTSIIIPNSVTSIGKNAFQYCYGLEKASISSNLTAIPEGMFSNCDALTSVTIPSKVTSIGAKAFTDCNVLSSVTIPSSVIAIGDCAFSGCNGLSSLTISSGVAEIGASAFSGCSKLTAVAIPDGVTAIGAGAFTDCDGLTTVSIPATVTSIGAGVFRGSEKLEQIWVNTANTTYSSDEDGVLFNKDKTLLIQAPGAISGSYAVPETVTQVGDYAFYYCEALTAVTLPDQVTTVGTYAFGQCAALTDVTLGIGVTALGDNAFYNCDSISEILLPEGLETIGADAFYDCDGLTGMDIPSGVTTLAFYTEYNGYKRTPFHGCDALEEIRVAEDNQTYASDEQGALYDKTMTTLLLVPAAMTGSYTTAASTATVSNYAFNSSCLTEVTLSDAITTISSYAFYNAKIEKVTVADSVTNIGTNAFRNCDLLTDLRLGSGIATVPQYMIYDCDAIQTLYLPSSITKISSYAFTGCGALQSVYIPSSVTTISAGSSSYSPFYDCNGSLVLYCGSASQPSGWGTYWNYLYNAEAQVKWSVTEAEGKFWTEDAWKETVVIPEYISTLPKYAFRNHKNLKKITIAEGVSEIPEYAFAGCTNLTSVNIPSRVASIGIYAFNGCTSLEKVYIPKSVTTITVSTYKESPFYGCSAELNIYCGAEASRPSGWSVYWNCYNYSGGYKYLDTVWNVSQEEGDFWLGESQQSQVVIPEGTTSIPADAFRNRADLTSITIPSTVTTIGDYAFSGCTGLTSVTIPDSVTSIDYRAFMGCTGLTSVTIPSSVTTLDTGVFSNCTGLTAVTIPEGVTRIGSEVFYNCTGLTSVTIPDSVTTIELSAFSKCTALKMVYIPASVTTIDSASTSGSAFGGCDPSLIIFCGAESKPSSWDSWWNKITPASSGDSYTTCWGITPAEYNFWSVTAQKENVVIPDTITAIPAYAFYNRTDLKSVTIGRNVASIGSKAFSGCSGLTQIRFAGTAPTIADDAFTGVSARADYPGQDESWTADVMQNYGGTINWGGLCTGGHTPAVDAAVAPNCTETGLTEGSHCSVCDVVLTAQTVVPALGHEEVTEEETPSTCTQPGFTASSYCGVCGEPMKAAQLIPAAHKPVTDAAVAPTCTETGLTEGSHCEACGTVFVAQEAIPATHTPVTDAAVAPTCTETGLTEGSHCDICGAVLTAQKEVPATGHAFENGICSCGAQTGSCGETMTWQLDTDGVLTIIGSGAMENESHGSAPWFDSRMKITELVIGADVESIGTYAFSYCLNLEKITFEGNAPASIGANAFWKVEATANYTYNETWTKEIRQNYGGTITWKADCGGQHIVIIDKAVAATCTETGLTEGSHCDACGEVLTVQEETPSLGHTPVTDAAVAPGCETTGLTEGSHCDICGETLTAQKTVAVLGHDMGQWVATEESTCTEKGTNRKDCSRCDHFETEEIAMKEHAYVDNVCQVCRLPKDLKYSDSDGEVIYGKYTGTEEDLVLPESVAGKPVTKIEENAFTDSETLTTIVIPGTVTNIGDNAFSGCENLTDVYYGGTQEEWEATQTVVPDTTNVHYNCTDPETHWKPITVDATCEEGSYTAEICDCGHERGRVPTGNNALGHTEVIDEAVPATCTETGLTEGKHCERCGETLTAQATIAALGHDMGQWVTAKEPTCTEKGTNQKDCSRCDYFETEEVDALGHNFQVEEDHFVCQRCEKTTTLSLTKEYILLQPGMTYQLSDIVAPAEVAGELEGWDVKGDESSVSVSKNGVVTAGDKAGTVYISAKLGNVLSVPCRIDVATETENVIQLSSTKLTTELYSTNYTEFEILLQLPQDANTASQSAAMAAAGMESENLVVEFTNENLKKLFKIVAKDDRQFAIVADDGAVNNPGQVAKSYTTGIHVEGKGFDVTLQGVTLTVKKTTPKLKASISSFNSFYEGQTQQIKITGGTVKTITATALLSWLTLEENALTLAENAAKKKLSGKAYLMVETEEWRIPMPVTLSVKNSYKAMLKLSKSSITVSELVKPNEYALKLLCTGKKDTLAKLKVADVTVSENSGYRVESFMENGTFTLKAPEGFKNDSVELIVTFEDSDKTVILPLTVKTAEAKLNKSSMSLNRNAKDTAVVTVTATLSDYTPDLNKETIKLLDSAGVEQTNSGVLDITVNKNQITAAVTDQTPDKETYMLHICDSNGLEAVVTIKIINITPSVIYKAKGSLDLTFPGQEVTVTPTFKNYSGSVESVDMTAVNSKKKDATDQFQAWVDKDDGKTIHVSYGENLPVTGTYTLTLKLTLVDSEQEDKIVTVTNKVKVTVKRTAVKLKLGASSVSLNKDMKDTADVAVTCATQNYAFETPQIELRDGKGKKTLVKYGETLEGNGKLKVEWQEQSGTLHIEPIGAGYGESFQIRLRANDHGAVSTLKVSIPSAKNSKVTVSLKAKGTLDVIRQGSAITVTPSYKNCTAGKDWEETLLIYSSADKYKNPIQDDRFKVEKMEGGYRLSQNMAENAAPLNPNFKYKVQLISKLDGMEIESSKVSISVKMGSAKLTMGKSGTTLFAKDKYDRALIWFDAKDVALNDVQKVTIKDSKYKNVFEVIDYGNGQFAIGFNKENEAYKSLTGKKASVAVTLNLNIILEGNGTGKANTTAKLKLTIVN